MVTLGEAIITDMPSIVRAQQLRVKAQGSTVYTHYTPAEIAEMTYSMGAQGIFIP